MSDTPTSTWCPRCGTQTRADILTPDATNTVGVALCYETCDACKHDQRVWDNTEQETTT